MAKKVSKKVQRAQKSQKATQAPAQPQDQPQDQPDAAPFPRFPRISLRRFKKPPPFRLAGGLLKDEE